jgi:hypothetical protein
MEPSALYYVRVKKRGYVPFFPEYYYRDEIEVFEEVKKKVGLFDLNEGEIKHLEIKMEKGCTLKGKIFKKDSEGIIPFKNASLYLSLYFPKTDTYWQGMKRAGIKSIPTDDKGEFIIESLEPSEHYSIQLLEDGYATQRLKDICVKKSETSVINHTFDFTAAAIVEGTITIDGKVPKELYIQILHLFNINGTEMVKGCAYHVLNNSSKFSVLGIPPGDYMMAIVAYNEKDEEYSKKIKFYISNSDKKTININL